MTAAIRHYDTEAEAYIRASNLVAWHPDLAIIVAAEHDINLGVQWIVTATSRQAPGRTLYYREDGTIS